MQDLAEDFISKIEGITDKIKSKAKELESEIKKVRKRKLDTERLSILYNKGSESVMFAKLFSKKVDDELVIQNKFSKKVNNKIEKVAKPKGLSR